jgi:hypothetical protein
LLAGLQKKYKALLLRWWWIRRAKVEQFFKVYGENARKKRTGETNRETWRQIEIQRRISHEWITP